MVLITNILKKNQKQNVKNTLKPKFKLEKQYKGDYNGYHLYIVVDAAKQEHWKAHSDWLNEGYVTVVGSSERETKAGIDAIHDRIRRIQLYHKLHGKHR